MNSEIPSDKAVLKTWKKAFPDAAIIVPVPNNVVISHSLTGNKLKIPGAGPVKLDGIPWTHPLIVNALYGWQVAPNGVVGNWYEIILQEYAGRDGCDSAVQAFRKAIYRQCEGVDVSSDHFHWKGGDAPAFALHMTSYSLDPITFSKCIIKALKVYGKVARKNGARYHRTSVPKKPKKPKCNRKDARVLALLKEYFPDAAQVVDIPNKSTFSFSFTGNKLGIPEHPIVLNGTTWTSPLVTANLYGYQTAKDGTVGNWLEVMIPEVAGSGSTPSAGEVYVRALQDEGLSVESDHFHWKGSNSTMFAIHHASYKKSPREFLEGTLRALSAYADAAKANA